MNTILRKSVLGIAGLAFTGGVFAGPVAAHAADTTASVRPVSVTVQGDKLIPHGVQGEQSRIELNDEQTANVKAIIAATKK
ncbi:hypothetical protein ABZS65_29925, partial [Micromonospora sp. NPDC005313]